MSRIVITTVDESLEGSQSDPQAGVKSHQVLDHDRPIQLWKHRLEPNATLRMLAVDFGRLLFVWDGSALVFGERFVQDAAIVVEHRANVDVRAGAEGCELLEFQSIAAVPHRDGGRVHALNLDRAPSTDLPNGRGHVLSDADCPTCELWLHRNGFETPFHSPRHCHTEDEVIVCTKGSIRFGTRDLGRGGVLAINKNAFYSFSTTDESAAFINFRSSESAVIIADKTGAHSPRKESLKGLCAKPTSAVAFDWVAT